MKDRIENINPDCEVVALKMFYTEETYEQLFGYNLDFVIDASDTISYKIHLIKECLNRNIPIISSMGAANKMDPTRFQIADISKTHTDPIAKVIRTKLRKEGIRKEFRLSFLMKVRLSFAKMFEKWLAMMTLKIEKQKCHHRQMPLFHPLQV